MTADNHMNDVMSRWGYDPLLPSQVILEQIQLYRPSTIRSIQFQFKHERHKLKKKISIFLIENPV